MGDEHDVVDAYFPAEQPEPAELAESYDADYDWPDEGGGYEAEPPDELEQLRPEVQRMVMEELEGDHEARAAHAQWEAEREQAAQAQETQQLEETVQDAYTMIEEEARQVGYGSISDENRERVGVAVVQQLAALRDAALAQGYSFDDFLGHVEQFDLERALTREALEQVRVADVTRRAIQRV